MKTPRPKLDATRLATLALRNQGQVPLASLLAGLVPVETLRELARRFALSPKGFRIDRAPAATLAKLLAEADSPEIAEAACAALLSAQAPEPVADDTERVAAERAQLQHVHHLESELKARRQELERAREAAARHRSSEAALTHQLVQTQEALARRKSEDRERAQPMPAVTADDDNAHRLHAALRELHNLEEAEEELRHRVASQAARIRNLEQENEELHEQIPKGRRKKKEPPPPLPCVSDLFRVPKLTPAFYKSLESKDRRAAAQALQAIVLFCVEGPSYPGLEVKRLEGSPLYSLRAARKLRVFFLLPDDGSVEVVELVDREDQNTSLRRRRGAD